MRSRGRWPTTSSGRRTGRSESSTPRAGIRRRPSRSGHSWAFPRARPSRRRRPRASECGMGKTARSYLWRRGVDEDTGKQVCPCHPRVEWIGGLMARRNLSRRQLLRTSAVALLSANRWPGRLVGDEKDSGAFDFVNINDIHYVNDADGKWLADVVVKSIRDQAQKPDFVIIAGDLTENGSANEIGGVKAAMGALKLPLHVVVGNHDYVPKTKNRAAYEQAFPEAINYHFEHKGWNFVGLASTDGTKAQVNVLGPTLNWVDVYLRKIDKARPMLVFTHFPLGAGVPNRALNA